MIKQNYNKYYQYIHQNLIYRKRIDKIKDDRVYDIKNIKNNKLKYEKCFIRN